MQINPELSPQERAQLDRENVAVLMVGQALLGMISPNILGVAVDASDPLYLTIHFAIRELDDELQQDIDDISGDVYGWYGQDIDEVFVKIAVGPLSDVWEGNGHRQVFRMKPELF